MVLAAIGWTDIVRRAAIASRLSSADFAQALFDQLANHSNERGMGAHGGSACQRDPELVGVVPGLVVEVPDHFHVIRQEADWRDHDVLDVDLREHV